jgi:BirA family biotin operon repressor/biotin-[acetyl-CoA-carboxylase] ligase
MTTERLTPDGIKDGLGTRWLGRGSLRCHDVVESTNSEARRLGQEGAPDGTVVVSEAQTMGRGRRGRFWASPSGKGLYLSILLRPQCVPEALAGLTLVTGVSVAAAIRATGLQPQLKWPNDVLLDHRKAGGILTEAVFKQNGVDFAVVGIGLNVNTAQHEFPEGVRDLATSLRVSLGEQVSRTRLLQRLLHEQEQWYERFTSGDFEDILETWRQFDTTLGEMVEVVLPEKRFVGVAESLDKDGALLVRDGQGKLVRVVAGDVVRCRFQAIF